jgi:hypothetical protein
LRGEVRLRTLLPLALLAAACSHLMPKGGSPDDAQRMVAQYLRLLRWQGLEDSARLLVPEQREVYKQKIRDDKLTDTLKVTEFELRELTPDPSGKQADATAELAWYIEPSVTVKKERLALHLVWSDKSNWQIASIEGGPLPLAAVPPATPPPAPAAVDAGAP